jgi:hypothetical protein
MDSRWEVRLDPRLDALPWIREEKRVLRILAKLTHGRAPRAQDCAGVDPDSYLSKWRRLDSAQRTAMAVLVESMRTLIWSDRAKGEPGHPIERHYIARLVRKSDGFALVKIDVFAYHDADDEPWYDRLMHLQRISRTPMSLLNKIVNPENSDYPRDVAFVFITQVLALAVARGLNGAQPFCRIIDPLPIMAAQFDRYAKACAGHLEEMKRVLPTGLDNGDESSLEFLRLWRDRDPGTICVAKTKDRVDDEEDPAGKVIDIYVFLLNRALLEYALLKPINACALCGQEATMRCTHCAQLYCGHECASK